MFISYEWNKAHTFNIQLTVANRKGKMGSTSNEGSVRPIEDSLRISHHICQAVGTINFTKTQRLKPLVFDYRTKTQMLSRERTKKENSAKRHAVKVSPCPQKQQKK